MNVSDLLNPLTTTTTPRSRCVSTPILSSQLQPSRLRPHSQYYIKNRHSYYQQQQEQQDDDEEEEEEEEEDMLHNNKPSVVAGKPRSRFSEYEDNIIRNGVAQRLTWGQISDLLPHRKRATCFNRYRTLQGIRKSRKSAASSSSSSSDMMMTTSCSSSTTTSCSSADNSPQSPSTASFSSSPITPPLYNTTYYNNSSSSADIIYQPIPIYKNEQRQHFHGSGAYDNDYSSAPVMTTTTKRSHRISLPAISSYQYQRHPM